MTDLTAGRETSRADVPVPRPSVEPPVALGDGVPLTRLLAMARLTPAQAVELGSGVLAAVAGRSERAVGPPAGDRVGVSEVVVGTDGRVALRPLAHHSSDPGNGAAGSVGAILAEVARAARLHPARSDPAAEHVLGELDLAVAQLAADAVPVVAGRLDELAAAEDRSAVRGQLAALVRALGGDAVLPGSVGSAGARPTAVRAARPAGGVSRDTRNSRDTRSARRRIRAWVLTVLVLAGVVLLEFAVLRDKVAGDIRALLDAGRGGVTATATTTSKPDGLPIVPPAPAAAGRVRAVDLRLLAPCAAGSRCDLRLLVSVVPAARPQVVTWSYRIVDRCTGAARAVRGGSVTVPPRSPQAVLVTAVRLPADRAQGILAVTRVPAVAASAPVLVGSCTSGAG